MALSNSSSSSALSTFSGTIFSVCVPFESRPGFAIPLVQSGERSNANYIQRVDLFQRIIGFELLRDPRRSQLITKHCDVAVGDQEVFGIVDPEGIARVGRRKDLSQVVRSWLTEISDPLSRLSFARFCRNDAIANDAAREAISEKAKSFGDESQAIRWFVYVVVLVDLMDALSRSREGIDEDLFSFGRMHVNVVKGRVIIVLPEEMLESQKNLSKSDQSSFSNSLVFANRVTGRVIELVSHLDFSDRTEDKNVRLLRRMRNIANHGRQEKRLAEIMRTLIIEPTMGLDVLDKYKDKGSFANAALDVLKSLPRASFSSGEGENQLAEVLPSIVQSAYPMQKGSLLLALASSLHESEMLSQMLLGMTKRSKARDVQELRPQILEVLKSE